MESYSKYRLNELESELLNSSQYPILLSKDWLLNFDNKPGVYIIFDRNNEIIYVGESGALRKRMKDLGDTRNHSLRRSISKEVFSDHSGFVAGSSSKKMSLEFEKLLDEKFKDNYLVSAISVDFGRKELEESIIDKYNPIFNSRKRREGDNVKAYSVSEIRKSHNSAYKPWLPEDELDLVRLKKGGKSNKEIGEILGRKSSAISSRIKKLIERGEF